MDFPSELLYTNDHEWVRIEGNKAIVGITAFAAAELGDIVYVDIASGGEVLEQHDIFGTLEAVKTVADLFMPINGRIKEVNAALADAPELVTKDPYGKGWMIKIEIATELEDTGLLSVDDYRKMIGV